MNTPQRPVDVRRRLRDDRGQVSAFVLILLLALLGFGGLVYDGGAALDAKTRALDVAESAARAGAQQLDLTGLREHGSAAAHLDPTAARAAALAWLADQHTTGTATTTPTTVTVTVTATVHTHLLGALGLHTLTVHATGTAHPRQQPAG